VTGTILRRVDPRARFYRDDVRAGLFVLEAIGRYSRSSVKRSWATGGLRLLPHSE